MKGRDLLVNLIVVGCFIGIFELIGYGAMTNIFHSSEMTIMYYEYTVAALGIVVLFLMIFFG